MAIHRFYRRINRPVASGSENDPHGATGSFASSSDLIRLAALLILGALVGVAYGQHYLGMMPLDDDSLTSISDPYLTRYWYDGFLYPDLASAYSRDPYGPLWLTYVKTDQEGNLQICSHNLTIRYPHQLEISPVFVVTESEPGVILRTPIVENFQGKPVAIWLEEDGSRVDLRYSVFEDDAWSQPDIITNDDAIESSPAFFTVDAEFLPEQDEPLNYLFWVGGTDICASQLDENWEWNDFEVIYEGDLPVDYLIPRLTVEHNLWLLFDEVREPDSLYVKALIDHSESGVWIGPSTLLHLEGAASHANLDFSYWYGYWEGILVLSWVDNDALSDTLVSCLGPTITFLPELNEWPEEQFTSFAFVSNTLLAEAGCVISPFPHYLCAVGTSEGNRVLMHNEDSYPTHDIEITTTDNSVSTLALSGLSDFHSVGAWVEDDGVQSDLYVAFFFHQVGFAGEVLRPSELPLYLYPAYPNPLSHSGTITYELTEASIIDLALYDSAGRRVRQIIAGRLDKGTYQTRMPISGISSGTYYCILSSEQGRMTRTLIVRR